jgi:protein ImuB
MSRAACLVVCDFPAAALVRANPDYAGAPLAITRSLAPHAEIEFVSASARSVGIRAGMTIAQARTASSALNVAMRSPAAEASAHAALADAAQSVSPVVEPGAPGIVWIDIEGLDRIFSSEEALGRELAARVRRCGMEAAIGIADGRDLAHLAARCGGIRVIARGREREFIDWVPLDMVAAGRTARGDDLEMTLARWGMRRLGDLARLDPDTIGTRLGRRGVELVRLARGGSNSPIVARRAAEEFCESIDLEYGIDNLEPLAFVMRPMLERLSSRLKLRGLVGGDITLAMGLEGRRIASRRVAVAASTTDVHAWLALVTLALEANPPEAAAESIRITIEPRNPRPAQVDLFLPPSPAPEKLETTVARIAAMCGPENVGAPAVENSWRAGAMRVDRFAPPPAPPIIPPPCESAGNVTRLMIRAIRPAREVEVMCARGAPSFIRGDNLGARVISIAGPWRRDGEWWRAVADDPAICAGFNRDYYDLALDDGGVYRVFCDTRSRRWYLDGIYD